MTNKFPVVLFLPNPKALLRWGSEQKLKRNPGEDSGVVFAKSTVKISHYSQIANRSVRPDHFLDDKNQSLVE